MLKAVRTSKTKKIMGNFTNLWELLIIFFLVSMSLMISADVRQTKDGNCRQKLMAISKNPILIGQTVPQCDKDGNYNERQCSGSTGSCWCVNKLTGQEIEYLHVDKNGLPLCEPNCLLELVRQPSILIHGEPFFLSYVPNCDKTTGYFLPKQCLKKVCWCVSKLGKEIENTRSTETISCPT